MQKTAKTIKIQFTQQDSNSVSSPSNQIIGIMADSHGNSAANTQEISVEAPRISALQQEGIASDSLVEYLKVNKSKFSWAGTFTELIEFTNKYLHLGDGVAKVIDNENKKTIKSDHLILNWYEY